MTRISYILIVAILGLSSKLLAQSSNKSSVDNGQDYVETRYKNIDWTTKTICEIGQLEFFDIYDKLDSISDDQFERLVVVEKLKTIGFTKTDWGRGNWELGPRIVSITLTNGQCDCRVDKLYYSTDAKTKYKVTERIACKPTSR